MAALLGALVLTAVAALLAVVPVVLLWRLPAGWAAAVATLLVALAVVPVRHAGMAGGALALLPYVALPTAWGMRRVPRQTLRIAATLAPPGRVFIGVWLPLVLPWIGAGLAFGMARALVGVGLAWAALLPLAAGAWPLARALAAR